MGRSSFASCCNFFHLCTFPPTARLQVSFFSLFPGKLKQVQVEGGEKEKERFFVFSEGYFTVGNSKNHGAETWKMKSNHRG